MNEQSDMKTGQYLPLPTAKVYGVTRDAIRKFSTATAVTGEIHYHLEAARRAGYPDLVAPAHFFISLGLAMDGVHHRSDLSAGGISLDDPLALSRVVAGQTSVEWAGLIFAGDDIKVKRTVVGATNKTGRSGPMTIYTFCREYSRNGELLVRETYARIAR
jgi:hydroxyacyl-ACP dehydratase HTD2-like protein with hotdog domain